MLVAESHRGHNGTKRKELKYGTKLTSSFDDTESSLSERYMAMCGMCLMDI